MEQHQVTTTGKRNIWMRGVYMLLMALAYQLSGTLLFILAVIQFLVTLFGDVPNPRLASFGRSLGRYMQQLVNFLSFASEEVPFPFSDWPASS